MLNVDTFLAWPWHITEIREWVKTCLGYTKNPSINFTFDFQCQKRRQKKKETTCSWERKKKGKHNVKQEQNALSFFSLAREHIMGDLKAILRVILSEKLCFTSILHTLYKPLTVFFPVPDYCFDMQNYKAQICCEACVRLCTKTWSLSHSPIGLRFRLCEKFANQNWNSFSTLLWALPIQSLKLKADQYFLIFIFILCLSTWIVN